MKIAHGSPLCFTLLTRFWERPGRGGVASMRAAFLPAYHPLPWQRESERASRGDGLRWRTTWMRCWTRFTKILTKGANEEEDIDEIIKDIDENTYARNFTKQTPGSLSSASENNNTATQTHDVARYTLVEVQHHMVLEQIFHKELVISYVVLHVTSVFCIIMTISGINHVITFFLGITCLNSAS
ncbi:cilia- and flagella-associated protein 418 isoform X3 [Candoia aspera]|uniref:cilia- and flagella-associated protein 418 isoform X3 n=1 Tax=Candoia aspera TaxID=51853 RepID=UPI002FD824EC